MTPAAQRAVESSSRLITKLRSLLRTGQGGVHPLHQDSAQDDGPGSPRNAGRARRTRRGGG